MSADQSDSMSLKRRLIIATAMVLAVAGWCIAIVIHFPSYPDTKLAKPLDRLPTADELQRLQSVRGLPAAKVLYTLGHPIRVERQPDGRERWDYPWPAVACVYFRDGVATDTYYTAGY
jgi:hypothetical protein